LTTVTPMDSIYLDHAATTPLHPDVLTAMIPYLRDFYGNPSSLHRFGREARSAISRARDTIAECLGCSPGELVFTSGGTESDNAAIFGVAAAHAARRRTLGARQGHIVTSQTEHHAVLHACAKLETQGFEVTYVPVDGFGRVRVGDVIEALKPDTVLVSIMMGNNEVGTLQPIGEIGRSLREKGILFHVDAVQALGSVHIRLNDLPVDLMSFSAHKINGPKGIGALYVSRRVSDWIPLLSGGNQERKRRPGTENVPGIVGFAEAVRIACLNLTEKVRLLEQLRETMIRNLRSELGDSAFIVNGHPTERLPHILNISFPGIDTETMLMNLDLEGIAASGGSACTAGSLEVSHVLRAMGLSDQVAQSAVRFSFGMNNTPEQVEEASRKIATIVRRIRNRY